MGSGLLLIPPSTPPADPIHQVIIGYCVRFPLRPSYLPDTGTPCRHGSDEELHRAYGRAGFPALIGDRYLTFTTDEAIRLARLLNANKMTGQARTLRGLIWISGIDIWLFALICRMKYSQWVGIAAALLLVVACMLPWAWYPDINQHFTGFHSESNDYGRPGKVLTFLSVVAIAFYLIPRIWAKRSNMLIGAFALAFAIRCYYVYTACYRGICPEKEAGIFLIVAAAGVMLLTSFLPDLNSLNRPRQAQPKRPS
jgi:hypothetical protein